MCLRIWADNEGPDQTDQGLRCPFTELLNIVEHNGEQMT